MAVQHLPVGSVGGGGAVGVQDEAPAAAVVGWPGGASPPGSRRSVRDSLLSYGSCCPGHLAAGFSHAQWAKYRGRVAAASAQARMAFFQVRYLRYLFVSHRIRQVLMRWSTGVSADRRNAPLFKSRRVLADQRLQAVRDVDERDAFG